MGINNFVDSFNIFTTLFQLFNRSPRVVMFKSVRAHMMMRTALSPLLRREHSKITRFILLFIKMIHMSRHFVEVAGSMMELSIAFSRQQNLLCLNWSYLATFSTQELILPSLAEL